MIRSIRQHLSYANVMATVAVFIALGGGAFAALKLEKDQVKSKHIGAGQVKASDLGNAAVTGEKLAANSVGGASVIDDSLTGDDVDEASLNVPVAPTSLPPSGPASGDLSGQYPSPQIAAGAVGTNEVDSSLTGEDLVESSLSGIGAGVVSARLENLPASGAALGAPVGTTSPALTTNHIDGQHQAPSVTTVARDFSFEIQDNTGFDAGDSRTANFVVNSSFTPLCTITSPATSCTSALSISLPANANYDLSVSESGSPPAGQDALIGYRLLTP